MVLDRAGVRLGAGNVYIVALSRDGTLLVVGGPLGLAGYSFDTFESLWHTPTDSPVRDVWFAAGDESVVASTDTRIFHISDPMTGQNVTTHQIPAVDLTAPVISPDGRLAAAGTPTGDVILWEVASPSSARFLAGHTAPVLSVAFSPDGSMLASAGDDNLVMLWDTRSGELLETLTGHSAGRWGVGITALEFSPDGHVLASHGGNEEVFLWDVNQRVKRLALEVGPGSVKKMAFSPNSSLLATREDDGERATFRLWDTQDGSLLEEFQGGESYADGVAFSPRGEELVVPGPNNSVVVWNIQTGAPARILKGLNLGSGKIAFSPDGDALATCAANYVERTVDAIVWDPVGTGLEKPAVKHELSVPMHRGLLVDECTDLAFSEDSATLWMAHGVGDAVLWSLSPPEVIWRQDREIPPGDTWEWETAATFNGVDLAAGVDSRGVFVLALEGPATEQRLDWGGSRDIVRDLSFSPDRQHFAAATEGGSPALFDLADRRMVEMLPGLDGRMTTIGFSPDGSLLAGGYADGSVALWDVAARALTWSTLAHSDAIEDLAFSPDGLSLATASSDGTVAMWSVTSPRKFKVLEGHGGPVTGVAFPPSGSSLASNSDDGTVIIWQVGSD
jgi:WD40 repeat protein